MMATVDLLAVRPHPDDESSATGALLAHYSARGVRTAVVTCTRGEEGEIVDPQLDSSLAADRLGAIRERELRAACATLGVSEVHLLGYRDSGMAGAATNRHPDAFVRADLDEATGRLVRLLRTLRPRVVVTENAAGSYGHPDHLMCHRVSVRAFEAAADPLQYPEAGPAWSPASMYVVEGWDRIADRLCEHACTLAARLQRCPTHCPHRVRPSVSIDVSAQLDVQRAALACHQTQIAPESWWLTLPTAARHDTFGKTYLRRIHGAASEAETDEIPELS
jgi:LmbE family N-acetylglucosaminyl deacetylase